MHKDIWKKIYFGNIRTGEKNTFSHGIFIILNPIQPLKKFKDPRNRFFETKKRQAVEQYIYDPVYVKIAFIYALYIQMEMYGKGTR